MMQGVDVTITVVVKGTPEEARAAARARQIHLTEIQEGAHGCTTAKAGSRFAKPISDWYTARHDNADKEGRYLPGTLLLYRER